MRFGLAREDLSDSTSADAARLIDLYIEAATRVLAERTRENRDACRARAARPEGDHAHVERVRALRRDAGVGDAGAADGTIDAAKDAGPDAESEAMSGKDAANDASEDALPDTADPGQ